MEGSMRKHAMLSLAMCLITPSPRQHRMCIRFSRYPTRGSIPRWFEEADFFLPVPTHGVIKVQPAGQFVKVLVYEEILVEVDTEDAIIT